MDELEHKLRSALTEMAEEVPPSHHAWTEQERRLALKSRRNRLRPALMAAVAAAVVALIAVPVVIFNVRNGPVEVGAVPMPPDQAEDSAQLLPSADGEYKVRYRPLGDEKLSTNPMIIGTAGKSGETAYVYTYTVRTSKGIDQLCFARSGEGDEINGPDQRSKYGDSQCAQLNRPKSGFYWGMRPAPFAANTGGTFVYVMSTPAGRLMLRDVNERLIVAQQRSVGTDFTVFVAYMDSNQPAKAWTVKDDADGLLQNGP